MCGIYTNSVEGLMYPQSGAIGLKLKEPGRSFFYSGGFVFYSVGLVWAQNKKILFS